MKKLIVIITILFSTPAIALEAGQILKLTPEAKFAFRVSGDLKILKKLDDLSNGVQVWLTYPANSNERFPKAQIIYTLPNGMLFAGAVFDDNMKMLSLDYARAVQNEFEARLLHLDRSIPLKLYQTDSGWEQRMMLLSSNDDWVAYAKLIQDTIKERDTLNVAPFTLFVKPTGDYTTPANSFYKLSAFGKEWVAKQFESGAFANITGDITNNITPKQKGWLTSIIQDGNDIANQLSLPSLGNTLVFRKRVLSLTDTTTKDDIEKFILGFDNQ